MFPVGDELSVGGVVGFYERAIVDFTLYGSKAKLWRGPQFGAIGAIAAHWSLDDSEPTVISIPTGSGKTAIGMVAPLLISPTPTRVLVLVPNVQLRKQVVEQFSSQSQLISLGVLPRDIELPSVHGMTGRTSDWESLRVHDVVVALPNSISPAQYDEALGPPLDLFDRVIVDEAHHAPASTWQAVLEHFAAPHRLLLTATPRRRDGRRIPGSLEFYYPLRRALEEGLYNPLGMSE
jgi:superfamily II DNA or RNA helicase